MRTDTHSRFAIFRPFSCWCSLRYGTYVGSCLLLTVLALFYLEWLQYIHRTHSVESEFTCTTWLLHLLGVKASMYVFVYVRMYRELLDVLRHGGTNARGGPIWGNVLQVLPSSLRHRTYRAYLWRNFTRRMVWLRSSGMEVLG